jgi:transposase
VNRFGVEGTSSYGAGLTRFLHQADIEVVEVIRPARQGRRLNGKNDVLDAETAARAALAETELGQSKSQDGTVEMIRILRVARRSAMKARTQAANQLRSLVVTAPDSMRQRLRGLPLGRLAEAAARFVYPMWTVSILLIYWM